MNLVLFADDEWIKVLVFVAAFAVWVIKAVIQGVKEDAAKPARRPPQRPMQQPPRAGEANAANQPAQPHAELERFLEDLGVKKKEPPRPQPRPVAVQQRPQPVRSQPPRPAPKPQPQQRPEVRRVAPPSKKQDLSRQHLQSSLETRKPEVSVSTLEKQHLQTNIGTEESKFGTLTIQSSGVGRVDPKVNPMLELLQKKDSLARCFIVGEVFGKPLSLR